MKKLVFTLLLCMITTVFAANNVVNVYGWAGYVSSKVLKKFTQETGIRVNYSTFTNNQVLYTKLKIDPNIGYDVVIPSTYIVDRMRKEGMLCKLDKSKLSNFINLNPQVLNKAYDPHNKYSIPYLWGTTGILVNSKVYPVKNITSWNDLWHKSFKKKIVALNDMRDMFSIALKVLGYSVNDQNPAHIKRAYLKLKSLMPNLRAFVDNGSKQIFINGEANIGIVASGDAQQIIKNNSAFKYIYPKDGANIWFDSMVIPVGVKHIKNAYKFINFMLRLDVAKMISMHVGYATPNLAAIKLMPKTFRDNHILNPSVDDLKGSEIEVDLPQKIIKLYLQYWNRLKILNV